MFKIVLTPKTHKMFSYQGTHSTPEENENATITLHVGFVLEENSGLKVT